MATNRTKIQQEEDNSLCGKQREKTTSDNAVILKRLDEMEKNTRI